MLEVDLLVRQSINASDADTERHVILIAGKGKNKALVKKTLKLLKGNRQRVKIIDDKMKIFSRSKSGLYNQISDKKLDKYLTRLGLLNPETRVQVVYWHALLRLTELDLQSLLKAAFFTIVLADGRRRTMKYSRMKHIGLHLKRFLSQA